MTMQAEDERLGQVAFEAYSANTGGKSLATGEDLPMWGDLQDVYQTAWIAVARAVLMDLGGSMTVPPDEPEDEGDEAP